MLPPRYGPLIVLLALTSQACAATLHVVPNVYNSVSAEVRDTEVADRLGARAIEAAERGEASLALRLASQALHQDPKDERLRKAFGYELQDGAYRTGYQAKQVKRGYRWDQRFGWIKPETSAKWEAGERPAGRRWVSRAADRDRHAKIENGWQLRTDHFVVTTNHSLEAGARLAAQLEDLFQIWRQMFAGYWATDREVRQVLAGERVAPQPRRPFRVFYHRDKAGYVEHLQRRQPRIAETLGIYFDAAREAHFFHSDDPSQASLLRATLYHEAVHQLFQESATKARSPGENANFWVVEGVACWFETLRPAGDGVYKIGQGGRLRSAARITAPMPLAELAALGQSDLQRRADLSAIYAQSTAVVAMLMEQDPRGFVRYLRSVYHSRPDGNELARQLGKSEADLDMAYRRFVAERLPELAAPAPGH